MSLTGRKVTIFYQYKKAGISETLYTDSARDDVPPKIRDYLNFRFAFADDDFRGLYARISDLADKRRTLFVDLADEPGWVGKITENGASPTDVILFRALSNLGDGHPMFIHAFPAAFLKEDVVNPNGKWFDKFKAFADYLGSAASPWKLQTFTGNTIANRKPIATAFPESPRGFLITTPDAPAAVAGDTIAIGNVSSEGVGYKGRKVVQVVDAGAKTMLVGGAKPVGIIGTNAYYTVLTQALHPYRKIQPIKLTERKVGKPGGLPVGRQAATLSLRR